MTSRCRCGICCAGRLVAKGGSCEERGRGCQSWRAAAVCRLSARSGAGDSPVAWSLWAASGSCWALGRLPSPASPGLPAGSWLSGVHTRMLPECCRIPASNVLCVLMDKININLHFFFLFAFYLIFSSPEDFSLLLPPLAGIKITSQQGLDVAGGFVLSSSQVLLLTFGCRHVLGPFACSPHVCVLSNQPVPKRWMDEAKMLSECRNGFCSQRQSCR